MSDAREQVLAAVRAALAKPSPTAPAATAGHADAIEHGRRSIVPATPEGRLERFAAELSALAADLLIATDGKDAARKLHDHLDETGPGGRLAAVAKTPLVTEVAAELESAGHDVLRLDRHSPAERRSSLAGIDTVITGADHALAATGTLVCTAATLPDRIAAGLPRRHVAFLPADRLEPDLATLLAKHRALAQESLLFISGPSRTADVEKTLVLGAHGPAALTVVLVGACRTA